MQQPHADPVVAAERCRRALIRFAILLGAGVTLAWLGPAALFAPTLSSFLGVAALATAAMALIGREPIWQPVITRWDVAAWLEAVGLFSGLFVDNAAVRAFLETGNLSFP